MESTNQTKPTDRKMGPLSWFLMGVSLHIIGLITRYSVSSVAGDAIATVGTIFLIIWIVLLIRKVIKSPKKAEKQISNKSRRTIMIVSVSVGLLLVVAIGYPLFASKNCSSWAMQNGTYINDGNLYALAKDSTTGELVGIRYSEHYEACMQKRFGL